MLRNTKAVIGPCAGRSSPARAIVSSSLAKESEASDRTEATESSVVALEGEVEIGPAPEAERGDSVRFLRSIFAYFQADARYKSVI